jgi:monoamine oxidase
VTEPVTVVVVGAGLSGLIAARDLQRRGIDVIVLEATDRCGGRALAETSVLGSRVDLGGQWIGHDHHRLAALADELGTTRYVMHTGRTPSIIAEGRPLRLWSPGLLIAIASLLLLQLVRLSGRADRSGATVSSWLERVPGRARRLLEVVAWVSWTDDLDRMSVRSMLAMIRRQHGLVTMLSTRGGAQDSLIVEGVGTLAERIADELGSTLRLAQPVTGIERDDSGVTVRTPQAEFRADRVIVAVPPPIAARIQHVPALPDARTALERDSHMGVVYKALAVYPAPFWRATGSAEMIMLDDPGCGVFDSSPPGGPGHLCVLVGGPEAEALDRLAPAERKSTILSALAVQLGAGVLHPTGWHEKSWHLDPHAGGGYLALPDLRADFDLPMSAEPIGRIHWAGSESARDHPGYLDGAIEAGERAAREVADRLS